MAGQDHERATPSHDRLLQSERADTKPADDAAPVSPHLQRVRSVSRFVMGSGIIVLSVLFIGVAVITAASGGERAPQQRFVAQDIVVVSELISPPAFAVGGSCNGACRKGTVKATVNRVKERRWYRVADGTNRWHARP